MSRIKRKIRQEVSQIVDVLIPENKWEQYIDLMDRDNKFQKKNLIAIIFVMCQELEVFENLIEDLYFQLDLLQGPSAGVPKQTAPVAPAFKLRTVNDVIADLEKQHTPDTKAFYVSPQDWEILEKNIDPDLAKTKPEYGYGKEIDPLDGKEKTCLYNKDFPVFRRSLTQ
jgi:hypothetical protein